MRTEPPQKFRLGNLVQPLEVDPSKNHIFHSLLQPSFTSVLVGFHHHPKGATHYKTIGTLLGQRQRNMMS